MSADHSKNNAPEKPLKRSSRWKERLNRIKKKKMQKPKPSEEHLKSAHSREEEDVSAEDLFGSIPKAIDFDPFEGIDFGAPSAKSSSPKQLKKPISPQKHVKAQSHKSGVKDKKPTNPAIPDGNNRHTSEAESIPADFDPLEGIDGKTASLTNSDLRIKDDSLIDGMGLTDLSAASSTGDLSMTLSKRPPVQTQVVTLKDPTSDDWWPKAFDYVEVHRLKEKLLADMQVNDQNTLMVTSPHDGAGCTFLAFMLGFSAASFSQIRVLLVDLNMRNPGLHRPFDLSLENGFTEVSAGSIDWKDAIKNTSFGGLKLLSAGSQDIQLSFALKHSKTREMLAEMKAEYDLIIFDTSPVLAHNRQNVDPAFIGLISDVVIVVIQDKITHKSELVATVDTIKNNGGNIQGIVYNQQFKMNSVPKLLRRFLKR